MILAIIFTVLSVVVMLVGIFWTLHRVDRLKSGAGRRGRRWAIGGHAEFSLPEWFAAMRSGQWHGPALPLLVACLGMLGLVYGLGTLVLLNVIRDFGPVGIAVVVAGLLYVTFMLGWAYIDSNVRASRLLRERDSRGSEGGTWSFMDPL